MLLRNWRRKIVWTLVEHLLFFVLFFTIIYDFENKKIFYYKFLGV